MSQNQIQPVYQEIQPSDGLKGIVFNYWKFSVPLIEKPLYHIIPPDGCVSLTFTINKYLPTTLVEFSGLGFEMKEVEIPPETTFIGIRFHPGAFNLVYQQSIEQIKSTFIDASADPDLSAIAKIMKYDFNNFQIFDEMLSQRVSGTLDKRVSKAVQIIIDQNGDIPIQEIHNSITLEKRQFQRLFKRLVGVSAKEFSRLIRIRSALFDLVLNYDILKNIAYDRGFYDQSHFNRDLLKMSQKSPGGLKKYYQTIQMQFPK